MPFQNHLSVCNCFQRSYNLEKRVLEEINITMATTNIYRLCNTQQQEIHNFNDTTQTKHKINISLVLSITSDLHSTNNT